MGRVEESIVKDYEIIMSKRETLLLADKWKTNSFAGLP